MKAMPETGVCEIPGCGEPCVLAAYDLTTRARFVREALRDTGSWPWRCRTHLEALISDVLRVILVARERSAAYWIENDKYHRLRLRAGFVDER